MGTWMLEIRDLAFPLTITLCFKHAGYFLKAGVNVSFWGHLLHQGNESLQFLYFLGRGSARATWDSALFPCVLPCSPSQGPELNSCL